MYAGGDLGPSSSYEETEIRTADGAVLRARCLEPDGALRATLVLAHAMFARGSSMRALARDLTARGYRTVAFDFRGHGESTPPRARADGGYDDLVIGDLPAVVECAQARTEGHPVLVVGHSLGAHVAVAAQGAGHMHADALVLLAGNVWVRDLEPRASRWAAKVAVARGMLAVVERVGFFPARRLRIGSDDASGRMLRDLFAGVTEGAWKYMGKAGRVKAPVAAVLGERDAIMCHPACGEAFARRCGGPVRVWRAPTGHMGVLRAPETLAAIDWAVGQAVAAQTRP